MIQLETCFTWINAPPYAEQDSEEIDDEIIARLNPKTGAIERLAILFFSKRIQSQKYLELPR